MEGIFKKLKKEDFVSLVGEETEARLESLALRRKVPALALRCGAQVKMHTSKGEYFDLETYGDSWWSDEMVQKRFCSWDEDGKKWHKLFLSLNMETGQVIFRNSKTGPISASEGPWRYFEVPSNLSAKGARRALEELHSFLNMAFHKKEERYLNDLIRAIEKLKVNWDFVMEDDKDRVEPVLFEGNLDSDGSLRDDRKCFSCSVYLKLNLETGEMGIGTEKGVPPVMSVEADPNLSLNGCEELLKCCFPLGQEVLDGSKVRYDKAKGKYVVTLTEQAQNSWDEIRERTAWTYEYIEDLYENFP